MPIILAQLSPQRSTQYTDLVRDLVPYELKMTAIGRYLSDEPSLIQLGQQNYLKLSFDESLDESIIAELDYLAMTNAYFYYYDQIGDVSGPLLKPIPIDSRAYMPTDLIATRRYRGKTNEVFTQFMCNLARASSGFAETAWQKLTLVDPLSGGGTTLFVGLAFGADVVGVEQDKKVVDGTVAFIKQYAKESRISMKFREDKLKNVGKRWFISINDSMRCVIGRGDTVDVEQFVHGLKRPQLIVTDLPYNIQHQGQWQEMLKSALPAWYQVLAEGGAMVFSWNATRMSRDEMIAVVQAVSDFTVLNDPPYNQLAHQVDRVIKERDLIVAVK